MDPIMEAVLEIIGDRGQLGRGEARELFNEIDDQHPGYLYEAMLGPAVNAVEDALTARKEGNEVEEGE